MNTTAAIMKFFAPPVVRMAELKALKASMTQIQWDAFGQEVCAALSMIWEPPAKK